MGTTRTRDAQTTDGICDEEPTKPKAMPGAARSRLYRQRQRARGMVPFKGHILAGTHGYLHALSTIHGCTLSQAIDLAVGHLMRGEPASLVRPWNQTSGYPHTPLLLHPGGFKAAPNPEPPSNWEFQDDCLPRILGLPSK